MLDLERYFVGLRACEDHSVRQDVHRDLRPASGVESEDGAATALSKVVQVSLSRIEHSRTNPEYLGHELSALDLC